MSDLVTRGDLTIQVEPKAKPDKRDDEKHRDYEGGDADPSVALTALSKVGFEIVGAPRRKPRHFEILGRKAGEVSEIHVEFDENIRHAKPVDRADSKWAKELEPCIN